MALEGHFDWDQDQTGGFGALGFWLERGCSKWGHRLGWEGLCRGEKRLGQWPRREKASLICLDRCHPHMNEDYHRWVALPLHSGTCSPHKLSWEHTLVPDMENEWMKDFIVWIGHDPISLGLVLLYLSVAGFEPDACWSFFSPVPLCSTPYFVC